MISDNPKPIKDYHVAFARAVVALAREHGVDQVTMEFRRGWSTTHNIEAAERWDSNIVCLHWHAGRHGAPAPVELKLEARASAVVPEKEGEA